MRISNRNKRVFYLLISPFLALLTFFCLFLFYFNKNRIERVDTVGVYTSAITIVLWILLFIRGKMIFEYDSDGEAFLFRNESIYFNSSRGGDEFPKYKLLKFEILNLFFLKKLYITVSSKKKNRMILQYNISYLTRSQVKDLERSLGFVLEENAKK
ncbi:MAG: hypothetical protein FDW93_01645 [Bergeyella sp.]|nr:hypothetical protein [Bergeyella sp.]